MMFHFKYSKFVLLATATTMNLGIAKAIPQNIDNGMAATTNSLTGCSANYDGQFGLAWVGAYEFIPPRTMDCSANGSQTAFRGTLTEGIIRLTKGDGSAATMVLKNDGVVGPLYDDEGSGDVAKTDGFAICDGGFVKLDDTEVFWGCSRVAEGVTDVMLENEGNCRAIKPQILPCQGIEGTQVSR